MANPRSRSNGASGSIAARLVPWLGIALIIILVDQLAKIAIKRTFSYGERVHLLPSLDFTFLLNKGAAFSFLAYADGWQRWVLTGIAVAAAVFIIIMLLRYGSQKMFAFALALILGGALGNLIDRVVFGQVVDFILVYWHDWYFPAFNVADSAISIGATLLVLDELRRVRRG